jgi:PAS domain S-box-containing protein
VHGKVELQMDSESAETEATSERAERLANLLTLSYEPMLMWRLHGAIEFWNAGAERLYGFSPQEAVGRSSHSLLQTKFPIDFAELQSQLRSERYWSGELRHVRKDGNEVVVDSRMQLLGADTVLEVNRDVTEVKALGARQATLLHDHLATAAKFEALFNQSGLFAGILDLQGCLREVNNLAVEWCGYTREQVLDQPFWETPWWRGSQEMKARIRFAKDQAASGFVFREELRYWLADGSERTVDFAMYPIRDQSGAVVFLHPTGIDITERKQIEAALHESEQRLRSLASIVESSDDAIVSKNLDGIIESWNTGAERVFGYTAEEAIGQPITIVIPEDRRGAQYSYAHQTRRAHRPFRDHPSTQERQLDCRFTDRFSRQECRRQDRRCVEDCQGHYRAEAKSGTNRDACSRSGAPQQEPAGDRSGDRQSFSGRHGRGSEKGH